MARQLSAEPISPPERELLSNMLTDITSLRTQLTAAIADVTALRATVAATNTKLNADGGVTDTDYAAPAAITAANPSAATVTA